MRIPKNIELEAFARACAAIDTPLARRAMWYSLYDPKQIIQLNCDSSTYTSAHDFAVDYFVVSYLSKWKGLRPFTKIDTKAVAIAGWEACESVNAETNIRFRHIRSATFLCSRDAHAILHYAQRKIASVLGVFSFEKATEMCGWSGGATATIKRADASLHKKLSEPPTVTSTARHYFERLYDPHWAFAHSSFHGCVPEIKTLEYSRFLTVDKNAKTDRCISAEPTVNMFLQKGVGNYIRRRLKRFGIDLDDQSRNQSLAEHAQRLGLATLDLKSASDTLSTELVNSLLPIDWFLYLDDIRTRSTMLPDGRIVKLEKFSSMGNGFTFELESLIFWALSAATCDHLGIPKGNVGVFGDDIIVDSQAAPLLIDILAICGFTINADKSFISGRFYESCGKHFFDGFEVTPTYQKECTIAPEELIRASNRLTRWALRVCWVEDWYVLQSKRLYRQAFRRWMPSRIRDIPRIPLTQQGDDGFLESNMSKFRRGCMNKGVLCLVYTFRATPLNIDPIYSPFLLAHKYRFPLHRNICPKGHDTIEKRDVGRYLFTERWIAR